MNPWVIYFAILAFGVAIGAVFEHYLAPKPELDQDQLFMTLDLIDAEFAGEKNEYDKVRDMRAELYRWMEVKGQCEISTPLWVIIQRVRDVANYDDKDFRD